MLHEATFESLRQLPLKLHQDRRMSGVKRPRFIFISNSVSPMFLCVCVCVCVQAEIRTSKLTAKCVPRDVMHGLYQGFLYVQNVAVSWYSSGVLIFLQFFSWQSTTTFSVGWLAYHTCKIRSNWCTLLSKLLCNFYIIHEVYKMWPRAAGCSSLWYRVSIISFAPVIKYGLLIADFHET